MTQPIAGQTLGSAHLAAHTSTYDLNAYWGFVGDGATDNSPQAQALSAALEGSGAANIGTVLTLAPGVYRFNTTVNWYNIPSLRIEGRAGRHYQGTGTTATPITPTGVVLEGWMTSGTLFKFDRPNDATYVTGNTNTTHAAPTFQFLGFQDGRMVASRRSVTTLALSSGTKYVFTTNTTHGFVAGDSVFINMVNYDTAPFGSAFNGKWTVAASPAPTGTTFVIDIGSNPSLTGIDFTAGHQANGADVRYAPALTLLDIEHETRVRAYDCYFHGGKIGLQMGAGPGSGTVNDVSWGNITGSSFNLNDTGILFTGDQAQSVAVTGGDYQLAWNQIGIDFVGSKAMFKARDFKMDTLYNDGQGVIGIRLQQSTQFMVDGSFEMDGPAIDIQIGAASSAQGRIAASFQGNNKGAKGSRVGKAIEIGVGDANATGVTTNASPNISLASYTNTDRHTYFDAPDVGKTITGTNIPAATTILSVTDATHAVMSANATGSGSAISFAWSWLLGTTSGNLDVSEMTLSGSTFTAHGIAVDIGPSSRGVTIMGGSCTFCDIGANIQTGASNTTLAFFKRRRAESGGSDATFAANHIVDNGTATQRIFCDNIVSPGGVVPAAGSTTMTSGFVHISSGAGAPTGVPTNAYPGIVPLYFDTTGLKLYAYTGGSWKTQAGAFA